MKPNSLNPKQQAGGAPSFVRLMVAAFLLGGSLMATTAQTASDRPEWGTYQYPFAADSPWNLRPIDPVLGSYVIPLSKYRPLIGGGPYSLTVFKAGPGDAPMRVSAYPDRKGVWDPDSEEFFDSITIPRWPAGVVPAEGNDGHADIVDTVTGMVHSFHKLRYRNGTWIASQYAWSRIDGRGWGTPAHYFQGARAAGVPSMGGLIRRHELDDGQMYYRHALAVSLTMNGMLAQPSYIYPATSGDGNAASTNSGQIPEGALLMLPQSFDATTLTSPQMRKVVETLKRYGAYVVDRNYGTPFYIYVENGGDIGLRTAARSTDVDQDLERIRTSLRQVVSASGWVDNEGRAATQDRNLNLLSMRGPWRVESGTTQGRYDTWAQAVVFSQTRERTVQVNYSSRLLKPVPWAMPKDGAPMRVTAQTTGDGRLRLLIVGKANKSTLFDSGELGNGQQATFAWPGADAAVMVHAISGIGAESSVGGSVTGVESTAR